MTLIVFSILIAFWLDGWREERAARELLRQHLEALVNEFEQTALKIASELRGAETSAQGTLRMIEMMEPGTSPRPEAVIAAVSQSLNVGIFTAQDPVLTAMLSSGELVDLRNDALMARLAGWQDRVSHLRTDSEHLERNREQALFDRLVFVGESFGTFVPDAPQSVERFGEREAALLMSDPGLRVVFLLRWNRAVRLTDSYRAALEEASTIVDMLEAEIAQLGAG